LTIEISNIRFCFPHKKEKNVVVQDLSLKIPHSKTMSLVGKSRFGISNISFALIQLFSPKALFSKGSILLQIKDNKNNKLIQDTII